MQSSGDRDVEDMCENMYAKQKREGIHFGCFLSLWHDTKAWSSVEAGVFYAIGSYCLDRFNRNPGPRLGTCYKLALEDAILS